MAAFGTTPAVDTSTAAETDAVPMTLDQHEINSTARSDKILRKIKNLREDVTTMSTTTGVPDVNVFGSGLGGSTGSSMGAGLGAGLLGGVLGGALLGGNGILGGGNNGAASTLVLENAIAANTALTAARFDAEAQREIQSSIERTAAATQTAALVQSSAIGVQMAKGQGDINTQVALTSGATQTQNALSAAALGVQVQKTAGDTQTQISQQTAALGVQTATTATANALATAMALKDQLLATATFAAQGEIQAANIGAVASAQLAAVNYGLATAIKADGDQTRSLINKLNDDTLNRLLVTAQNEIIELRGDRARVGDQAEMKLQITNVNTAIASQAQTQAQLQQQQQQYIANLSASVAALVNQNQIIHQGIVNLGTMTGNTQSSANTRVN